MRSKFFTEYLASKAGTKSDIKFPNYRIKDTQKPSSDYSFGCVDAATECKAIKMREVGDMWGAGLFKANTCDFCDDVVAKLADISLGDAWLESYSKDGRGTSVVVTKSPLAEKIIQDGIKSAAISIEPISPDSMRASQQGSYNHRHQGLHVRLKEAKKSGIPIDEIRYGKTAVPLDVALVQKLRRSSRKKSLDVWPRTQSAELFDQKIQSILSLLKLATKVTHIKRMGHMRIIERLCACIMRRK